MNPRKRREAFLLAEILAVHRPPDPACFAGGVDWDEVAAALVDNRAAGLAARRIGEFAPPGAAPAAVLETLGRHYRANQFANTLLLEEAGRVLREAPRRGVALVPVKGAAALADLYPDPGARRLADLDFLVEPERSADAAGLLAGLGYEPEGPRRPETGARGFRLRRRELTFRIDLSWAFPHRTTVARRREAAAVELIGRAVPAAVGGASARVLDREDRVIHTAAHLVLHHNLCLAPALADLCLIAGRHPDWNAVVERAARFGLLRTVVTALGAAGDLLGLDTGPRIPRLWRETERTIRRTPAGAFLDPEWVLGMAPRRGAGPRHNWARSWWQLSLRDDAAARARFFADCVVPDAARIWKTYRARNPLLVGLLKLIHVPVAAVLTAAAILLVTAAAPLYARKWRRTAPLAVRRARLTACRHVAGSAIVMVVRTRTVYRIDGVGASLLRFAENPVSIDEAAERIAEEYDVAVGRARADAARFARDLVRRGILAEVR